jgi:hypothetical protein
MAPGTAFLKGCGAHPAAAMSQRRAALGSVSASPEPRRWCDFGYARIVAASIEVIDEGAVNAVVATT